MTRKVPARSRADAGPAAHSRLTVAISVDTDGTRIARASLARLAQFVLRAERVHDAMLSVAFVSSRAMARLNRAHLGHAGATDVISFGHVSPHGRSKVVVGDIYVCPYVAAANARRFGVTKADEIQRLVVHGTLHVLGWDHPAGGRRERSPMWLRQERLLRAWTRREQAA